jgi:hypothetical protein
MGPVSGDVDEARKRAYRYWYEDGLSEVAVGCLFILIALALGVQAILPAGSAAAFLSELAFPVVVIGGMWAARRLVNAAKERITYPRTGYVRYRRSGPRRRWLSALIGGGMGAIAAFLFAQGPASLAWLPLLQGLIVGAVLLYIGSRLDLLRFYASAALSVLMGAAITLGGAAHLIGSAAYFGGLGVMLAAMGAFTLRSYLRQTQPTSETGEG